MAELLSPGKPALRPVHKRVTQVLILVVCAGTAASGAFAQQVKFVGAGSAQVRERVIVNLGAADLREQADALPNANRYVGKFIGTGASAPHRSVEWRGCSICVCTAGCDLLQSAFQTKEQQQGKEQQKKERPKKEQSKRLLWIVPNFAAVSSDTQLPPLSTKGKFQLAVADSFDYSAFVWTGVVAAQGFALNSVPELGQGVAGYTRYYWRALVDGVSGTFFTEAIVPSITHEDPRYYTLGDGSFFRRTAYALSRTVLTKTDSGGVSFNWSEVGGNLLEASLSNAYYPPSERGTSQTVRNWATQMESAALNNIAKEFWPDIRHAILRLK